MENIKNTKFNKFKNLIKENLNILTILSSSLMILVTALQPKIAPFAIAGSFAMYYFLKQDKNIFKNHKNKIIFPILSSGLASFYLAEFLTTDSSIAIFPATIWAFNAYISSISAKKLSKEDDKTDSINEIKEFLKLKDDVFQSFISTSAHLNDNDFKKITKFLIDLKSNKENYDKLSSILLINEKFNSLLLSGDNTKIDEAKEIYNKFFANILNIINIEAKSNLEKDMSELKVLTKNKL